MMDMKNIKIFLFTLLAISVSSCNPVIEDASMGTPIAAGDIDIDIRGATDGSNKIIMTNNTPGTIAYWDFIAGAATGQKVEAVLPFMGDVPIKCTIISAGGQTTVEKPVKITKLDNAIAPEWVLFAKDAGGKTWGWDPDVANVYGTAGYGSGNPAPGWSTWQVGGAPGDYPIDANEVMLFDIDGGANFTKMKNGTVVEKGRFGFDMSKKRIKADGSVWSIGELYLYDASIMVPYTAWYWTTVIYTFDIITLTEDKMVLSSHHPSSGFEVWAEGTFWMFSAR